MGSASSSAALASEAPGFGSLAAMGKSKPRKKPVLVLAPEELEQAHLLFQQGAAEQLGDFDPVERAARSASLFGLAPMGGEDDDADNAAPFQPLQDDFEDVEEAEAPEPDKVLALTRPRQATADGRPAADSASPFGTLRKAPIQLPELEAGSEGEDEGTPPEFADDHDYSDVAPGFSTNAEPAYHEPVKDPVGRDLARLIGAPRSTGEPEEQQPGIFEADGPAKDWASDDWDTGNWDAGNWDAVNGATGSDRPARDEPAGPAALDLSDANHDQVDDAWLSDDSAAEEPAAHTYAPLGSVLPEPDSVEPDTVDPVFEEPAALAIDHEVASVTVFDDETEDYAYVQPAEFAPQHGMQNTLRARLVREDVSIARPTPSIWRRIVTSVRRLYRHITFR